MREILLIVAVIALFALAVGGVSAHDGDQDDDRIDELRDQCMKTMGQMEDMMGSDGMMSGSDSARESDHGDDTHTDEGHDGQSNQGETGYC